MRWLAIILLLILVSGCAKQQPVAQVNNSQPGATARGVSISPKSFQPADFTDFFQKAKQGGAMVSWAGGWNELGSANGAPAVAMGLAPTYAYAP